MSVIKTSEGEFIISGLKQQILKAMDGRLSGDVSFQVPAVMLVGLINEIDKLNAKIAVDAVLLKSAESIFLKDIEQASSKKVDLPKALGNLFEDIFSIFEEVAPAKKASVKPKVEPKVESKVQSSDDDQVLKGLMAFADTIIASIEKAEAKSKAEPKVEKVEEQVKPEVKQEAKQKVQHPYYITSSIRYIKGDVNLENLHWQDGFAGLTELRSTQEELSDIFKYMKEKGIPVIKSW